MVFNQNSSHLAHFLLHDRCVPQHPLRSPDTMMQLNNYPLSKQEALHHGHNDDNQVAPYRPQFDDRCMTTQTFRDCMTLDKHSTLPIMGAWQSLESLNHALSPGVSARGSHQPHNLPMYTPLVIALNTVCMKVGMEGITERDLAQLHHSTWFHEFAKHSVKRHNAENFIDLSAGKVASPACLDEDHMVLLLEAFATSQGLTNIELGIVAFTKSGIKAFHYPWDSTCNGLTAWIVADFRFDSPAYYGLGHETVEQQKAVEQDDNDNGGEEEMGEEQGNGDDYLPRATAARVLAQRVPLPAGLTARDILEHYTENLQYNNILKVGLHFSNQDIAKKVAEEAVGRKKKVSNGASGIVKRINTGIDYIEKEFSIDAGAFRTAYDQARKANGISTRGKDEVDDLTLAANVSKINDAMAWVQTGGPRATATAVSG